MAAKFEETYQVPQMKHLVAACAHQYTKEQILKMEAEIVKCLGFELITDSAFKFYEPLALQGGL